MSVIWLFDLNRLKTLIDLTEFCKNHGWLLLWTHYLVDLHEFVGFVTWCFYAWLQQSWGIVLCCYLVVQLLAFLPCFQKSTLREKKHFCCNSLPPLDFVRYVQWSPLKNWFLHLKTSKLNKHCVEISWFFYHSDFMWNQFMRDSGSAKSAIWHI